MNSRFLVAAVVVLTAVAVPAAAVAVADTGTGSDEPNWEAPPVSISPADGPNGEYAAVEDGEIELSFEGLNDEARTQFHNVFVVTASGDEPAPVWVTTDVEGVDLYRADDPDQPLDSKEEAVELQPGESIAVGFVVDATGTLPDTGTVTIHSGFEESGDGTEDETDVEVGDGGNEGDTDGADETNETDETDDGTGDEPGTGTGEEDDTPSDEAEFDVDISAPDSVSVNESAEFVATVENVGNASGETTVDVEVNGEVVGQQTVGLDAGERTEFTLSETFSEPGEYEVAVRGETSDGGRVEVDAIEVMVETESGGTPSMSVTGARVDDEELRPGGSTTVVATVENTGDAAGTYEAELTVAGVVVAAETVRVPAGETRTVTFDRTFDRTGIFPVGVSGTAAGEVRVEEPSLVDSRQLPSDLSATAAGVSALGLGLLAGLGRKRRKVLAALRDRSD